MSRLAAGSPIPITRRHHLQVFTDTLEAQGCSSESVAKRLGLPMWQYGDADDWIPLKDTLAFFSEATRVTGEQQLGLLVSRAGHPATTTTFGKLVSSCPTLFSALRTTCKRAKQHTSLAHLWLFELGDDFWLCRNQYAGMSAGLREHEQYVIGFFLELIRRAAGPTWQPAEMSVSSPKQARLKESDDLAAVNIRYNQPYTAIALPKSIICRPLRANPSCGSFATIDRKHFPYHAPAAGDFVGSLRDVLGTLVKDGTTSLQEAAETLRLHPRTLQRRLLDGGTTYQDVLNEARFRLATRLLSEPGSTITEVACAVGYSDRSSFSRAFRHYAGIAPQQYKRIGNQL